MPRHALGVTLPVPDGVWDIMNEHHIARGMLLRVGRRVPETAPLAKALLDWATPHHIWLTGQEKIADQPTGWTDLLQSLDRFEREDEPRPPLFDLLGALADMLDFGRFDRDILFLLVACDRLPRLSELTGLFSAQGQDLPRLFGELAGADALDADRAVRASPVLRLELVRFSLDWQRHIEIDIGWTLARLLDRSPLAPEAMLDLLVGERQQARLSIKDFTQSEDIEFLAALLAGALHERAAGINILVHGPPGTGKTELARTLAAGAGAVLHAVGEADHDGDEPTREERVGSLRLAQRMLAGRTNSVLLFDEMEDLIGNAERGAGDWFSRRSGSKVFVNRMLESNPVPVIWTTNAIGNIDAAILRRMSFVLKLGLPSRASGHRMLGRIAAEEGIAGSPELRRLIDRAPETATILRVAARASRLAGDADGGTRSAEALVRALRGSELPPDGFDDIDLELMESDPPLGPLVDRMACSDALDISLLLTGPPGTGKTALAHHVARALDRPLLVRRTSDLLSPWVGGTERAIADAFAEAREQGGILFFDEADSLLFDRSTARTNWEVSQVNEMLTWLDRHPLPLIAATNHGGRLDPATLRRFVFKLDLLPLGHDRAARAFERFFARTAPVSLRHLAGLTPGDFAVVARQLRHAPAESAEEVVARLEAELAAKPASAGRMGFG